MSLSRLWLYLAVALPVLAAVLAAMSSVDLAYQLRAGGEILDSRAVPTVDTWTFTAAGLPWVDQQWGAQVVLAAVYRVAGWTGLVLLRALLTAAIIGGTVAIARIRGLDERLAALVAIAAFVVAAPAMALRPQLLGMACFVLTLFLVVSRRDHPQRLWAVPLVVAMWANLHGSFILGPLVLGLAWIEDVHDRVTSPHRTLLVAGAAALAACLTPFGPAVWAYAVGLSTDPSVTARTTEWQPTSLRDVSGVLFFASCAAVVALLARRRDAVGWPTLLWLGSFAALGAYAVRGVAWWPFVALAALAPLLTSALIGARGSGAIHRTRPGLPRLNGIVALVVAFAVVMLLPAWRPTDPRTGVPVGVLTEAPPGITAALRDHVRPGDRILNPQLWGSWLELAVPDATVAVDSRIEFFPAEVWSDYEGVYAGLDGWQDRLESWGVSIAITRPEDASLAARLEALGWSRAYGDADGAIWMAPARSVSAARAGSGQAVGASSA